MSQVLSASADVDSDLLRRIDELARTTFAPIAERWGERHETCRELVEAMAREGLFRINLPRELGGEDARYSTLLCHIREILGYHSPVADVTFALQGLGTAAIVRMGSPAQHDRYLPGLINGERLFSFGLTEPHSGSDVLGMRTRARRDGDEWVLDGEKMFVSGAPDADVYVVFARTDEEERGKGITAFIVEKGTPGFTPRGDIELAAPHAIGHLDFDGCRLPDSQRLGEVGEGLRAALGTLEVYRPSVGAYTLGVLRRARDLAVEFASGRQSFGQTLLDIPAIRIKIGRMVVAWLAGKALVEHAARLRDAGERTLREAAIAKVYATESAVAAVYESQQIHGGRGVMRTFEIEALARDVRPATIYEGASEIQRTVIARAVRTGRAAAFPAPAASVPADVRDLLGGLRETFAAWAADVAAAGHADDAVAWIRVADADIAIAAAEALAAADGVGTADVREPAVAVAAALAVRALATAVAATGVGGDAVRAGLADAERRAAGLGAAEDDLLLLAAARHLGRDR
jgi:acyl-CoA dehydrogenase